MRYYDIEFLEDFEWVHLPTHDNMTEALDEYKKAKEL